MSLLSSGTVQTILLLAAPFALPKAIHLVRRFLSPTPAGTRTSLHPAYKAASSPPDSYLRARFRLLLISLSLSLCLSALLTPPHNLFLALSTPQSLLQRFFPALRRPLDLRLATETLSRAWSIRLGGRALLDDELSLLSRLQTLDARSIYVAYGRTPLMSCSWCRPGSAMDHLLMLAPGLVLEYLSVLAAGGMLLGGGRKYWRKWLVVALVAGAVSEAYMRASWTGLRGGGAVVMLHSQLHLIRYSFFAATLAVSFFLPSARVSHSNSTAALVSPAIMTIVSHSESLLNHIRATGIERMAILHNKDPREKVVEFWSSAERESELARGDKDVQSAMRRDKERPKVVAAFREWLDEAVAVQPSQAETEQPPNGSGKAGAAA